MLRLVGLELRRLPRQEAEKPNARRGTFRPVESCQITNLETLLEMAFVPHRPGYFVEVGGYDGVSFSNTFHLAEAGWSGLILEPVPEFAAKCRAAHADHPNVVTLSMAAGPAAGEATILRAGPFSSLDSSMIEQYGRIDWAALRAGSAEPVRVAQDTLDSVLSKHLPAGARVDLMVVDVEGYEEEVFRGVDLERWRPTMLIVELADTHRAFDARTRGRQARLGRRIAGAGYVIVYKDAINTVFMRQDCYRGSRAFEHEEVGEHPEGE